MNIFFPVKILPPPPATSARRHWTFSLFYVVAEMWGSVVVATLFWGLVNQICTVAQSTAVSAPSSAGSQDPVGFNNVCSDVKIFGLFSPRF